MEKFFKKTKLTMVVPILALCLMIGIKSSKAQTYCQPTYNFGSQFGLFISNVILDSLVDSTGASGNPYYTFDTFSHTTSLFVGKTYTMEMSPGSWNNNGNSMAVWIDWNSDKDFDDNGEKLIQMDNMANYNTRSSFKFTVPCNASIGYTRLRVRMMYNNNNTNMAPCTQYAYGETQDYVIGILENPRHVEFATAYQLNVLDVAKGTNNQEILCTKLLVQGCSDTSKITDFKFSLNGTSDTTIITKASLYYTGNQNSFDTTNLFGSVTNPNNIFSFSGNQILKQDTNYFWLAYDISSSAVNGDDVDAEWLEYTADSTTDTPTVTAPNGKRIIANPMSFNDIYATQYTTGQVYRGTSKNEIIGIEIDMSSGASVPLTELKLNTNGCTNASTDISNARIYYTGSQTYFDSTNQFGSTIASPNGTLTFNGFLSLAPGINYLWLSYDITTGATMGDSVDAELVSATIDGASQTPSVTDPTGERIILRSHCLPVHGACATTFINGVTFGTISNTKSGCSSLSGAAYSDYSQAYYYTVLNRGLTYNLTVDNCNTDQKISFWGDWNQNGSFDAGEWTQVHTGNSLAAGTSITKAITIPCSASKGWTKIRIRSRNAQGNPNNGSTDACTQFGSGECEDYVVYVTDSQISNINIVSPSTADVTQGWTTQQITMLEMDATSCTSTAQLTNMYFNTNGTTNASSDISNAKVYFTGTSNVFATTTQFGSTIAAPSGGMSFSGTQNLVTGKNYLWLTYDIKANATSGNYVDASLDSFKVTNVTYKTNTNPTGNRKIASLMSVVDINAYNFDSTVVLIGSTGNQVLAVGVVMSQGASTKLTNMNFKSTGTTAASTDVANAKLYYSGKSKTFNIATSTQVGTAVTNLSGVFSFTTSTGISLVPDTNWFWLTYDITGTAKANNEVDAECVSMQINGTYDTPTVTNPSGARPIYKTYCTPTFNGGCGNEYIQSVWINTIANTNTGCTSITNTRYNSYPSTQFVTTLYKNSKYEIKMKSSNASQIFGVWIDWDQNGTYDASEFYNTGRTITANNNDSLTVTIPCTAKYGYTGIRIRSRSSAGTITSNDACTQFGTGEAEDYVLYIANNPNTGALGQDRVVCSNTPLTLNPGGGYLKYTWNTGDTTQTINVTTPGTYYVFYQTGSGCGYTDSITLTGSNISVNLGNDTAVCNGSPVTFNAPNGYTSYLWNTGDTTQSVTVSKPGYYSITVTNTDGCAAIDTIELIKQQANVNLGNDQTICSGFNTTLNAGAGFTSYLWNNGDTIQTLNVSQSGIYTVTVIDNTGCIGIDSIQVNVSTATTNFGQDISECAGSTVVLDGGNNTKFNWSTGDTTQTISISAIGSATYTINIENQYGCKNSDTIMVTINANPTLNLGPDAYICNNNVYTLDAGAGMKTYNWSNNAITQTIGVTTAGTYYVTITSNDGCKASDTITLTASSVSVTAGPDKTYCEGSVDSLLVPQGYNSYSWSEIATGTVMSIGSKFLPSKSGDYSITVSNSVGCKATDTIMVTINPKPDAGFTYQWASATTNTILFVPNKTGQGSYFWDFGDGTLNSKESPTYMYPVYGSYIVKLKVTSPQNCISETQQPILITGINQPVINEFNASIFPNPINNKAVLLYNINNNGKTVINIYDINGNLIENMMNENQSVGNYQLEIDGNKLTSGLYIIRIQNNNQTSVLKLNKVN